MKTHLESVSEYAVKEVVDEYTIYECDKGHRWEETLENHFDTNFPCPLNFPIPKGDNICPYCFGELLANLGRVQTKKVVV